MSFNQISSIMRAFTQDWNCHSDIRSNLNRNQVTLLQQTLAANDADVEEEGVGAQNAVGAAGVSFEFCQESSQSVKFANMS